MWFRRVLVWLFVAQVTAQVFARQAPDPKRSFVQALGAFSLALDGAYGDERHTIDSALGAMRQALEQWDRTVLTYESAMAAEIGGAAPPLAARMNAALAVVHLERHRVDAALRLLVAARALDPTRADVHALLGAVYDQKLKQPAAAADAFGRAAALDPANPTRAYVLARHLAKQGKQEEAMRALRVVVAGDAGQPAPQDRTLMPPPFIRLDLVPEAPDVEPFFPPVRYHAGFAALRQGDYAAAVAAFESAAASDPLAGGPGADRGALDGAARALRDGAIDLAIGQLTTAASLAPEHGEPRRLLGRAYALDGQVDAAVDALRHAIRLDGRDERARIALAETLAGAGRFDEAEDALRDTLTVLPSSGRARYVLARVHQRRGNYGDALREFEAAITFEPLLGVNSIYETIGTLQAAQQNFDAAITAYNARIDVHPNDPDAHVDLGEIYLRQGRHDEALAEFTVALLLDPEHIAAATGSAQAHLQNGAFERAADAARRALELDGAESEARYVLATSLIRAGRTEEGKRQLEIFQEQQAAAAAARTRSLQIEGLRREAAVSVAAGKHADGVALLREVLALEPSYTSHLELGLALLDAEQPGEALDHLNAAAKLNAPFDVHRYLAAAYAALGNTEQSEREQATYERLRREALRRRSGGR